MNQLLYAIPYSLCLLALVTSIVITVQNLRTNSLWHWILAWRLLFFAGVNGSLTYPSFLLIGKLAFFSHPQDLIFWSMIAPLLLTIALYLTFNFRWPHLRYDVHSGEEIFDFSGSFGFTFGLRVIPTKPRRFMCEVSDREFHFDVILSAKSFTGYIKWLFAKSIPADALLDYNLKAQPKTQNIDPLAEIVDRAWEQHRMVLEQMRDDKDASAAELKAMCLTMAAIAAKHYGWNLEVPRIRLLSVKKALPEEVTTRPHQVSIM